MNYKNTLQKGSVRFIIFREHGVWYAACLEFNIVEKGETPEEAFLLLSEATQGYVEGARKAKLRPHVLNQKSDPEYEAMWKGLQEARQTWQNSRNVFSFGSLNISNLSPRMAVPA